jgi:hypothetical protein
VDQPQAANYCSSLQYAGYGGWRLPTPEELQGIYDPSINKVKVVSGLTYEVHVKDGLNLTTGLIWSNREGEYPGRPYQDAWLFQFFDYPTSSFDRGKPLKNFLHIDFHMHALCVRRPEM